MEVCKQFAWEAFHSSNEHIVKTSSILISTIVCRGGLGVWSEIIDMLTEELKNDNQVLIEHSSYALSLIVEDSSRAFEGNKYNSSLDKLLNAIGSLLQTSENENVIVNVITTINTLIITSNSVIYD